MKGGRENISEAREKGAMNMECDGGTTLAQVNASIKLLLIML